MVKIYGESFYKEDYPCEAISATKEYFSTKPWRGNRTHKKFSPSRREQHLYNLGKYIEKLSLAYKVPVPIVMMSPDMGDSGVAVDNVLILSKYSTVTIMHEFRHYLQIKGKVKKTFTKFYPYDSLLGREEDAIAWSHSLFKISRPKMYKKALVEKRLKCGVISKLGLI